MNRKPRGIQCHECERFGHIRSECPTYMKSKGKKVITVSLSDTEYELSSGESHYFFR